MHNCRYCHICVYAKRSFIIIYGIQNILLPPMTHNIISRGSVYVTCSWSLFINVTPMRDYIFYFRKTFFYTLFGSRSKPFTAAFGSVYTVFSVHIVVLPKRKFSKHQRSRRQMHTYNVGLELEVRQQWRVGSLFLVPLRPALQNLADYIGLLVYGQPTLYCHHCSY